MSIFQEEELTQGQRLVWFALRELAVDGVCRCGPKAVAKHMDSGRAFVSKAIQRLHTCGWVSREGADVVHVHDEPRASQTRTDEGDEEKRVSQTRERASQTRVSQTRTPFPSTFPALPFSPKKEYHSTPFSQLTPSESPFPEEDESAKADRRDWLKAFVEEISWESEPLPDDHPARWEYHPDDWRWQAGKYMLDNLRELELLNSHYLRRLRNAASEGQIASEWADTFRLLVEQDGWQREEIAVTLRWLFETENWWKKNRVIQTAKSLRKRDDEGTTKFDKIIQSAVRDYEQRQENHVSPKEIYDGWDDNASDASKSAVSNGQRVEREGVGWHT